MDPLLQRLVQDDYQLILAECNQHNISKGEFIFEEGSPAEHFYFIQKGKVRLFKRMDGEREITIFMRGKEDGLGEIGIFSGIYYTNSAQAIEDSIIYAIEKTTLEMILNQQGAISLVFTKWIAESLEASKAKIRDFIVFGSEGAVASIFIRYTNMYGIVTPEGIQIKEPIVLRNVGRHIGVSRETVSRIVNKWQEHGIVERDNKYYLVKRINYFRKLLDCANCAVENCAL